MVMRGVLVVFLAALPAACGSGQAADASRVAPDGSTSGSPSATVAPDTGVGDTARTDAVHSGGLPAQPAGSSDVAASGGDSSVGMMGRGTMGRGMMGGRMGMMGQSGGQAPAASAQAAADTGGCPQITQALADEGRQIFTGPGNCATCHGANGQGGPLAPDLTDSTWLDTDGSYAGIAGIVRSGVPLPKQHPAPMPPMGGARLSADQVCAVAGYVYSLSHRK